MGIHRGDVVGMVLLGIGDLAVQVVAVDQLQQFGDIIADLRLERHAVVARPSQDHEVRRGLQRGRAAIGMDERGEVLLRDRPCDREDHGLGRVVEEPVQQRIDAEIGRAVRKLLQVAAGREHADPAWIIRIVVGVLNLRLVTRGGDDRGGTGNGFLLDRDATIQSGGLRAIAVERRQFHAAKRVRGEHVRDASSRRHTRRDQPGIGIMRVHDVGRAIQRSDVRDQRFDQAVMLGPQLLFDQVRIGCGRQADDAGGAVDRLDGLGIAFGVDRVPEGTGDYFHAVDRGIAAAGGDQIEEIPDMPPGIRGNSVFNVGCA